jgi:1-acyl-sn-glycerol-3-phosphate acyltransferase
LIEFGFPSGVSGSNLGILVPKTTSEIRGMDTVKNISAVLSQQFSTVLSQQSGRNWPGSRLLVDQFALGQGGAAPWLYHLIRPLNRAFLYQYFGDIQITGLNHLPRQGPMILAPKHASRWDPLVLSLLTSQPLRFMTNAQQIAGVQGWFIQRLGGFGVDITQPKPSSLKCAIALLRAGQRVVIFPEGGIEQSKPLRPLKPGLARLALQATSPIPIVPIALHYGSSPVAMPRRGASIQLEVLPPLLPQDVQAEKDPAIALTKALEARLVDAVLRLRLRSDLTGAYAAKRTGT